MAQPATPLQGIPASGGFSPATGGTPATTVALPGTPSATNQVSKPQRRGILSAAAVIFQIFGWIILVFGILSSIALAVFASIGGSFMSTIGLGAFGGVAAIGAAIGGIVASLLYGFGFLAFAEICYAIRNIEKSIVR
jgi:hypothetical protein